MVVGGGVGEYNISKLNVKKVKYTPSVRNFENVKSFHLDKDKR